MPGNNDDFKRGVCICVYMYTCVFMKIFMLPGSPFVMNTE